ncbi:MAG: ABC transporter substrate-binding protein [Anaerolinea sp.]|nr:ABC transporter substrate-binding protein [Anaerolinea sp.]
MKRNALLFSLILMLVFALVACGSPATAPTAEPVEEPMATEEPMEEPMATEEPAAEPMAEPADEMRTDNLEGETIRFYHFGDLSGPLAGITAPLVNGFNDAVAALNEQGGIRGATVSVDFIDTGGVVDNAVGAYDRFTGVNNANNVMIMFTYGSGEAEALASRFAEDKIVNLAAGLSAVAFYGPDSGYTFGYAPIYPDQFGLFMDWVVENWDDYKPATAGDDIKLAYISWPTAYGRGAMTDETMAYAESLGIEIVADEVIDVSPTADTTTAILNAQAAGANVIYTNSLAFGPASILNGLGALGLRDEFLVAGNNWAMDLATYAFISDGALAEGFIAPFPYLWWSDADNAGIQYAAQVFAANNRQPQERAVGYLLTFGGVDLAVQAIELAIDTVGFDNLTGEAVHHALAALGEIEILNGVMRADFSDGVRAPQVSQIRQIQGGPGAFVVLQDWTAMPDLRPSR